MLARYQRQHPSVILQLHLVNPCCIVERSLKVTEFAYTQRLRFEFAMKRLLPFFLSLLSREWSWVISKHRIISLSPRFTFANLIQGHIKSSDHRNFSSLLNSGQPDAKPKPRVTWCLVAALSCFLSSARLYWLYNIPNTHANSRGHTSSLLPMRCT